MKKLCLVLVIIAGAMNAATSQTQSEKIQELTLRIGELEKYVYQNVRPTVVQETVKRCSAKKRVFAMFGPKVRELKLCAPSNGKTTTVKINKLFVRRGNFVLIVPPVKNGVSQAFKLKVGRKYNPETFTTPLLISKSGVKITIQQ